MPVKSEYYLLSSLYFEIGVCKIVSRLVVQHYSAMHLRCTMPSCLIEVPITRKSTNFLYQCMGFTHVRAYCDVTTKWRLFRAIIPEVGYIFVIEAF